MADCKLLILLRCFLKHLSLSPPIGIWFTNKNNRCLSLTILSLSLFIVKLNVQKTDGNDGAEGGATNTNTNNLTVTPTRNIPIDINLE